MIQQTSRQMIPSKNRSAASFLAIMMVAGSFLPASTTAATPLRRRPWIPASRVSTSQQPMPFLWELRGGGSGDKSVDESTEDETKTPGETPLSSSTSESNQDSAENHDDSPVVEPMPAFVETTTTTVLQHHDSVDMLAQDPTVSPQDDDTIEIEEEELSSDSNGPTEVLSEEQIEQAIEQASQLRNEGKELHDQEEYAEAATRFSSAANLLFPALVSEDYNVADDFATCRLHEALCFLKAEKYQEAIRACTDVLDLPQGDAESSVEPALRARAFHRRAKAHVELGDEAAALQDARSAAFLGDRRAVALYGKLMRENSSSSLSSSGDLAVGSSDSSSELAASSALFESLLTKSSTESPLPSLGDSMGNMGPTFPTSLFDLMGTGAEKGESNAGSLAKSVLTSLSKRLHDESTQDQICNYLQNTSGPQLKQMASIAGIELQEGQASRLAAFCQGVTPKALRRTLRTTKVVYYVFQLIRRISQLISKYRGIIIMIIILGWIKSAILRPLPVNKRAARLAAKAAVSTVEAM